jgi:hypothetical protein
MPTNVIHIGAPKVGSKTLQTSLAALSDRLSEAKICYPLKAFSDRRQIWHGPLAERLALGKSEALERTFAELNSAGHEFICLSYEGFWGLDEAQLVYLRELTAGSPVRIVYYLRRWSDRIPSLWKQDVKEGFVETFPQYVVRAVSTPIRAPDLNPRIVWDKFAGVFGRDSICIVSLNNLLTHKVDLVEHFLRLFCQWRLPAPLPDGVANESPDIYDTELIRALNAIHLRRTGKISDMVRDNYLRIRSHLDVDHVNRAMREDVGEIAINDHAQVFDPVFEQMNAYRDRLMSRQYGEQFFYRVTKKSPYVQQNYLLDESVVRELLRLYEEVCVPPPVAYGAAK